MSANCGIATVQTVATACSVGPAAGVTHTVAVAAATAVVAGHTIPLAASQNPVCTAYLVLLLPLALLVIPITLLPPLHLLPLSIHHLAAVAAQPTAGVSKLLLDSAAGLPSRCTVVQSHPHPLRHVRHLFLLE